ncbi:MAG: T9SS type A sorting domain-containing protein [Bacteroidota bacterium]
MSTFFTRIFLVAALLGCLNSNAQTLLAKWTFPTGTPADSLADGGIPSNLTKAIRTDGGTSVIDFSKNGLTTKAAQATGWDNGALTKSWIIEVSTLNYNTLKISSKQQSGGNSPGPRDYTLQYRLGASGVWADVPNTTLVTANNWTSAVLDSVPLPDTCTNRPSVFLRWLMTTNTSSAGATVVSTGIDKIDDIYVTGKAVQTSVESIPQAAMMVFPNPCADILTIIADRQMAEVVLTNPSGIVVLKQTAGGSRRLSLDMGNLPAGIYLLKTTMNSGGTATMKIIHR